MAESQAYTVLGDLYYEDPSQLSQALRQRAGSDKPLHFTASTESHQSPTASPGVFARPRQPVPPSTLQLHLGVVLHPDRAHSPRRAANVKYVRPALPTHNSAPTSTGFTEHIGGALKMHHTFNGLDAPGDTQPDSQMHKQYTSALYSSIIEANQIAHMPKSLFVDNEDDDDDDDNAPPSDELDVVASSQEDADRTVTSPTVVDVEDHALFAQNSMAPTSPLKFETPALAGRKRDSSGHMLSSAMRTDTTPGTAASVSAFAAGFGMFGDSGIGGGPLISLTQAFNNTQAPTSPAVGPLNEDVVFQRPSPNFAHARHSSPGPAYSSPIKAPRPETPKSDPIVRSSSEPRSEYVTLKESQERRKVSIESARAQVDEVDDWNDLSRHVQARKRREEFHRRAARSLSHISAPTPATIRSTRKRAPDASYPSPDRSRAGQDVVYSDGAQDGEDQSLDELSQPDSMKAHDETEAVADTPTAVPIVVEIKNNHDRVQVPKTSSHPYHTPSGQTSRQSSQRPSPSSQLQRELQSRPQGSQSLLRGTFRPQSSKDSVAVMDSQPDIFADFDSIPPPKSLRFPSSPSTNQYSINQTSVLQAKTGFTSQVISSSIPPLPPRSSAEDDDELVEEEITPNDERVPSSPPVLTHDEDGENGEPIYDEYAEDIVDQEVPDLPPLNDAAMEDAEDLPLTEDEREDGGLGFEIVNDHEEAALDLIQPENADLGTDQEVPETLEQDHADHNEDINNVAKSEQWDPDSSPTHMHRMERQNTIPETDTLEEMHPSHFPTESDIGGHTNQTNSNERFQTAQEEQSGSKSRQLDPHSSKTDGSDGIATDQRIQSVNDIYNLPDTQRSAVEEDIEMPRLSGLDEEDELASPAPPSAKRRKLTYTAKRRAAHSPVKLSTDSESLSDPPTSSMNPHELAHAASTSALSTQRQEKCGIAAAAQARQETPEPYKPLATLKSRVRSRVTKVQTQKKGALKPISKELLHSLSSPGKSPSRAKDSMAVQPSTPVTPMKPSRASNTRDDVDMSNAKDSPDELADLPPVRANVEQVLERLSQQAASPAGDLLVPNRVFASWPGSHYYPATCIAQNTSTRQLDVRFDDGNTTTLDAVHVRALELLAGDHVKVDASGMKKFTYIVVGFKDQIDDRNDEQFPLTDRYGHSTVILEEKRRDSLASAKATAAAEHISVPMSSIYLTAGLWARLRHRSFTFAPTESPAKFPSRIGTPIAEPLATPSFTRRGTAVPSLLKDATARAASVTSTTRSGIGTFSNMAFVLTSTAADIDKEAIARTLKTNGGLVLEHGFHELFGFESSDASSSPDPRRSASVSEETSGLPLKDVYKDLGFVALISDSHSRSTKYIQALALNVPCLHFRWVQDSIAALRAKPFMRYLLPAGVSKFLDPHGVVRSRTIQPYDPAAEGVTFTQTMENRDLLLRDQSVLLITGKSKKEIERRQPFVFLTHALGAAIVGRCADFAAASAMLVDGQHWDWIYVDNGETAIADAAAELFGIEKPESTAKSKKNKKRKREETDSTEELLVPVQIGGRKVRVTCAEFVIQSLILGALIEE
ncbi:radiation sensitive protein rad9 [Coniothyrium glycines]